MDTIAMNGRVYFVDDDCNMMDVKSNPSRN